MHRLSQGEYAQIIPRDGDTFIGAPGAVLDGRRENQYAFGGHATDVTIQSLTSRTSAPAAPTTTRVW